MFKYIWMGMLLTIIIMWIIYVITDIIAILYNWIKYDHFYNPEPLTTLFIIAAPVALFISSFLYWCFM